MVKPLPTNLECPKCGKVCEIREDDPSFSYSGTHCTHGKSGIETLPLEWYSECCEADMAEELDMDGYFNVQWDENGEGY